MPYIFILCMEALGQMVEEKCKEKVWKLIKTSRNGIAFSQTTSWSLQRQMQQISPQLGMCWMSFAVSQDKRLVRLNREYFSPLTRIETLGSPYATSWASNLPRISANTWGFPSSPKVVIVKTSALCWTKSSTNSSGGKPISYPL